MRTVKEVSKLTGISVRALQYYDEIGLFKPTDVTDAGYRLYDDESLVTLQQILFFKELDFSLKEIKMIMDADDYEKTEAFKKQKILLTAKRDRLNELLNLLSQLEKGESSMSFKEFGLSEYLKMLEEFRNEKQDEIIEHWGSLAAFDEFIKRIEDHESDITKTAVQYYGSIEKYVAAMKKNLDHFSENMEKIQELKDKGYVEKNQYLMEKLMEDVSKDIRSKEVQDTVKELMDLGIEMSVHAEVGENYWDILIDNYLHKTETIEIMDKKYGVGASKFIGEALQYYFDEKSRS